MSTPPTPPRLVGCKLKLDRAKFHFDQFDGEALHFIEQVKPYRPGVPEPRQIDAQTIELTFRLIEDVLDPPETWGPMIGDVAHNLMSALDHLVFQLAILNNGDPDRTETEFPIFDLDNPYTRGKIRQDIFELTTDDQRLIRDMQPYQQGNQADARKHPLWLLREMNIIDKHRRMHLTTAGVFDEQIMVTRIVGLKLVSWQIIDGRKVGDEVLRATVRGYGTDAPARDIHLGTMGLVKFGSGSGALAGMSVRSLLPEIAKFIRDDVFAKFAHRVGALPTVW